MTDAGLRDLERKIASGEDPWSLLLAQVRIGKRHPFIQCARCEGSGFIEVCVPPPDDPFTLTHPTWRTESCPDCEGTGRAFLKDGMELAAYLGDERAREAVRWSCPPGAGPHEHRGPLAPERSSCLVHADKWKTEDWLHGLGYWVDAPLRAALAAAQCALLVWEAPRPIQEHFPRLRGDRDYLVGARSLCSRCGGRDPDCNSAVCTTSCAPRHAIEVVEAYVACPCRGHQAVCRLWAERSTTDGTDFANAADRLLWAIAELPQTSRCVNGDTALERAFRYFVKTAGDAAIRAAICADLLPFSLGMGDPVAERVNKHRG